jgi:hypothetical protein
VCPFFLNVGTNRDGQTRCVEDEKNTSRFKYHVYLVPVYGRFRDYFWDSVLHFFILFLVVLVVVVVVAAVVAARDATVIDVVRRTRRLVPCHDIP